MSGSILDDHQKHNVETRAKRWRNAVRRGDCSAAYAAETIAGDITYPYAPTALFEAYRAHALKYVK